MRKIFLFSILFAFLFFGLAEGNQEGFNVPSISPSVKNIKIRLDVPLVLSPSNVNIITIKKTPITFKPFDYNFFKITKSQVITLENGNKITGEEFLREINEIEKKLNSYGYSLRDKEEEIVIQKILIKRDDLEMQRKLLRSITPFAVLQPVQNEEPMKEFKDYNFSKKWDLDLGDNNFNINISTNLEMKGKESQILTNAYALAEAGILGRKAQLIKIETNLVSGNNNGDDAKLNVYILEKKEYSKNFKTKYDLKENLRYGVDWGFPISAPVGPFNITGTFGIRGGIGLELSSNLDSLSCSISVKPSIDTKAFAEIGIDYKVASAGVGGELTILKDELLLKGSLALVLQDPLYNSFFNVSALGENNLDALSGDLYFFVKVNYLVGSKKFKAQIYEWDGFSYNTSLFNYSLNEPAYKDKVMWLVVKDIRGITPYTARNEKIDISSKRFYVEAVIGGETFSTMIPDTDGNGIADHDWVLKIPLSSRSIEVPIKIRVIQEYYARSLKFKNDLDILKGEGKDLDFILDLNTETLKGAVNEKIGKDYICTGDTNYFGERYHTITVKVTPNLEFMPASDKAK
ncbi:hypothetical protein [Dictyoglomus thermophilum]|uniref:Uncharacterized protein n=1 Tax=Dictyoglomus thermophilum (strain ATCC 35947 / DSM 3960 / H-6-12) TaxID=309799 RepID=B5YAJ4_DICT6|nr:hypothetical protein [Dictyoglomus thermophilum]ACI19989.1 hypothetical protein DICTH_1652 [Dictyoglomus thermophilum H-6-12]